MIRIYGIRNCDTMKKALEWLAEQGIEYEFQDYRKSGIEQESLENWEAVLGWERLLNRRGTTWRRLPDEVKSGIDRKSAIRLMLDAPSIIKRPILVTQRGVYVGFSETKYREIFR